MVNYLRAGSAKTPEQTDAICPDCVLRKASTVEKWKASTGLAHPAGHDHRGRLLPHGLEVDDFSKRGVDRVDWSLQ
jgi:hypothetical protein